MKNSHQLMLVTLFVFLSGCTSGSTSTPKAQADSISPAGYINRGKDVIRLRRAHAAREQNQRRQAAKKSFS
jgi:hypothetical protein